MKKNYLKKNNIIPSVAAKIKTTTLLKRLVLPILILFGFFSASGQVTTVSITTTGAGSWTPPCGVTSITVEAWGAGGSGGGTSTNNAKGGGGGAGGTYVSSTLTVVPGTPYNLYVAPTNTAAANSVGAKGNGSWFNTNTTLFAEGGNGGAAPNGGTVLGGAGSITSSIGTTKIAGASGTNGTATISGAGGSGANGGGAGGGTTTGGNGLNGTPIGGGGGGAFVNNNTNRDGGNGARGEIRITYTNVIPANPGNPTSDSPQCNPPGVTLTRAAVPPVTENHYWQTVLLGTNTSNNTSTSNVTTSGTYYIRSQDIATGCWSTGQGSLAVVVSTPISSLATTPTPSNAATGICYSGSSPVTSISWAAAAGATSYDVYFGAGSLPGSVTSNVATTSFTTGTLLASTTYYWQIVPRNPCGISSGTPITWSFTTASKPCYCTPTGTTSYWITNFTTTGGVTNIANTTANSNIYGDYTASSVSQLAGSAINLSISTSSGTHYFYGWVDWNNDGDFLDAGEDIFATSTYTTGYAGSYTIPSLQAAGSYRMRIANSWLGAITSCTAGGYSEYEDYTLVVLPLPACTTPTAQPTALNLTVSGTTINGSFTAASPAPSGYLIVRSSSATPPTLTNGTTYAVGFTGLTPGTTNVIQGSAITSNAISFSDTGLTASTQYYYYVFSYNNNCIGAPFYLTTTPLNNNATTCIVTPTAPVNSAITGTSFTVTWSASVGAINYVLEVYTNAAYTIPIAGSPFTVASPTVTYNVTGLNGPVTYYYRIKATNASCSSGYVTGTVTTLLSNDECSGAIPLTISSTCTYISTSSVGATASAGIPAPGCASYSNGDVWFSAVVPATGELDVDLQGGSITDSGMAFYSGTCGALTLLECDDDDGTGLMSYISMTGLTVGQTIYIRVWKFGGGTGTFGICATTPSCPSPSDLLANILSTTSVTVNWNASTPPASGGYQYFISPTNTPPTNATPPTGTTAPGVIGVTLTGLTPGQKYYFWVRSFCGGSDTSTWFGPTNYTPCAVGNGTGTTSLACPSVLSGGLGLNGANPPAMSCQALGCVDLEATYLQLNQPTNYSVASIPYSPPYQFTCLQNPVSVNVDDIWSPTINLPFNFCFYGNNYNKCLIGSNGVITFDTTTYAPGGYNAWSFASNLPNATLFRNTIFGVYHDIDPSKGGQVGYELITLNTGCRALVASWNDIPMYSSTCNSQLYTGMIVLYENTNVIEVYIKEKNVCATWNDGNAIVGLQNAAGTAAVVAPNRNGLSTDWPATNEAWRFTPTGTSLTSIKWFQGNGTTGPQLGTTDTINVCPTSTTTYTAEVTYALCSGTNLKYTDNVVVTVNGTKIWNGSQNTTAWNDGLNWTPNGIPTNANCVIIPQVGNNFYPVISAAPDAVGYNLNVYNNASLTINSSQNLTITDRVTVQPTGVFTLNNSASLIQINNVLNSGNIIYKRTSPNIRTFDYVYWSSPVANFNISNIVTPFAFGPIYHWNTTVANANGGQGTWQNFSGNMVAGKGYIARSPSSAPFNNSTFNPLNGTFTGVPNNGNITIPIERGNDQNTATHYGTNGIEISNFSDNWNLLGNPYPSALRGSQFLFDNNTKIEGNIRLWTHGNLPYYTTNPFYNSFVYNYTSGDYLTYNFTGTSCCPAAASDLFIGSGQGFFVQMIDGPQVLAANNVTVAFNNNQRGAGFDNSVFYKTAIPSTNTESFNVSNLERNRIWLDLINPNGQSDRTLFGYIENATMGIDSFFDCLTQNSGGTLIFSETGETKFTIQGRSLPFDVNDEVPIGINAPAQGEYTIGIAAVDGLFNSQNIYLKDNLLDITHNLKDSPYHFTTQSGGISNRFKVVYVDTTLETPTYTFDENSIKVVTNNEVAVSSSTLTMESIDVFNILGQKLDTYKNVNSNYIILSNLHKNNTTLLLKIKLQTGETVTRKIIF